MNIVIFASIGCQNLGDELILKNTIKYFEKKYKDQKPIFHVFTYDIENIFFEQKNVRYHEYFPSGMRKISRIAKNIKNYSNFIKVIKKSNLVVIGGGGLFFDNEGTVSSLKNLNSWIFRKKIVKSYKKPIVFYGVGINFSDNEDKIYQSKINTIFSKSQEVYVRDNFSHDYLQKIGISSEIILDPVYNDHKKYKEKKELLVASFQVKNIGKKHLDGIDFKKKTVGLALRELELPGYENKIIEIIEYMVQKGAKVIILPHSFHPFDAKSNDYTFFQELLGKYFNTNNFQKKDAKVYICESMEETYNHYKEKKLDLVLASRLHSIILSRVYKLPYLALSYSRKTDEQL